jgi:uncharacterized protein (TIGR02246 family)
LANSHLVHNRKEIAMLRFIIATSLIGLLLIVSAFALGQETIEETIIKRVKQYEATSNAGNTDSMAAIYAIDGTHTFAHGVTLRGRVEIANGLKEQYAGMLKGTHMSITPLHIRSLSTEIAVEEASFVLSGLKGAGGVDLPPIDGLCLVVYQKDGDQWYIAAAQCMVPPQPPQGK